MKKRKIRLEWEVDGKKTWEDYLVPKETPSNVIQRAIDIALLTHNNESEVFVSIMNNFGYKTVMSREDIEVYDFNSIENTFLNEIDSSSYDINSSLINLMSITDKEIAQVTNDGGIKFLNQMELFSMAIDSLEKEDVLLEDDLIKSLCKNTTETALKIINETENEFQLLFDDISLDEAKKLMSEHEKETTANSTPEQK